MDLSTSHIQEYPSVYFISFNNLLIPEQKYFFAPAMHLSLIPFLVAVADVIALPVLKMDLDTQMAVRGKLEAREPQVSL